MKSMLLMYAIQMVMGFLTPELLLKLVTLINEKVSLFVLKSDNTIDDAIWAVIKEGPGAQTKLMIDTILDFGETFVLGTVSKLDDAIAIPFFNAVRAAFNIPDND